ncbi:PLP-dependent transferase [Rhizobium beringeri]
MRWALPAAWRAISSAVLSFVEPGDRIVAVKHVYPDAFRLFGTILKRMKIEVTYVDGRDEEAVAKALPGAKIFLHGKPTSWVMEAHDVGRSQHSPDNKASSR